MDQEVARTLAELESKLRELERELTSIGRRQNVAAPQPSTVQQQPSSAQPGQPGVLVDEVVERRYTMDAQQTVYGEIPATKDAHQSIDLAELVRFKETMQRTLQGLIDEYSRLLSLRPPAGS